MEDDKPLCSNHTEAPFGGQMSSLGYYFLWSVWDAYESMENIPKTKYNRQILRFCGKNSSSPASYLVKILDILTKFKKYFSKISPLQRVDV